MPLSNAEMFCFALPPNILRVIVGPYRLLPQWHARLSRPLAGRAPPIKAGTEGSQTSSISCSRSSLTSELSTTMSFRPCAARAALHIRHRSASSGRDAPPRWFAPWDWRGVFSVLGAAHSGRSHRFHNRQALALRVHQQAAQLGFHILSFERRTPAPESSRTTLLSSLPLRCAPGRGQSCRDTCGSLLPT